MKNASGKKISLLKRENWLSHVEISEKSDLSHAAYCKRAGISYSGFKYWRGILLNENTSKEKDKFVSVKIEKSTPLVPESSPRAIQVKLVSGTVIYIPATLSMSDIGQLIRSLESAHA